MKQTRRDEVLSRILASETAGGVAGSSQALSQAELLRVSEGLAFAMRPLRAATGEVTGKYSLGPRGAWILSLISGGACFPLELSLALKTGRSLITAELARLTEAGLITARADEKDRRRSVLALTPLGQAACQQVRDKMSRIIRENLSGYSADEIRLFSRMLRAVRGAESGDGKLDC